MRLAMIAGLVVALALTVPAGADRTITGSNHLPLVIPDGAPVRLAEMSKVTSYARFKGTFRLTGTYHIVRNTVSEASDYIEATFEPDAAFVARLPYWKPYKQHASVIAFENQEAFLKAVLTKDARIELLRNHKATINGRATIKVTNFRTSVECDWPNFWVRFLSIENTPVLLAGTQYENIGC